MSTEPWDEMAPELNRKVFTLIAIATVNSASSAAAAVLTVATSRRELLLLALTSEAFSVPPGV